MRRVLFAIFLLAGCLSALAAPVTVRWANPSTWSDGSPLTQAQIRFANLYCADWMVSVPVTGPSAVFEVTDSASCRLTIVATKTDANGYRESDPSGPFALASAAFGGPTSITVEFQAPAVCTTRCTVPQSP